MKTLKSLLINHKWTKASKTITSYSDDLYNFITNVSSSISHKKNIFEWSSHKVTFMVKIKFFLRCPFCSNLNSLIIEQKKAIRCITNSQYNIHTGPLLKKQKILPFESLLLFFRLKFMFESKNNLMPRSFENVWQYRGNLNNLNCYVIILNLTFLDFTLVEKLPLCSFSARWNNYIDIDNVNNTSNKNQFISKPKKIF